MRAPGLGKPGAFFMAYSAASGMRGVALLGQLSNHFKQWGMRWRDDCNAARVIGWPSTPQDRIWPLADSRVDPLDENC